MKNLLEKVPERSLIVVTIAVLYIVCGVFMLSIMKINERIDHLVVRVNSISQQISENK